MIYENSLDWFRLAQVKGVGAKFLWDVYDLITHESLTLNDLLVDHSRKSINVPTKFSSKIASYWEQDDEKITDAYEQLTENQVKILDVDSPNFPVKLKEYGRQYSIPPILYARGNTPLANCQSISIVGSRHVNDELIAISSNLAQELAQAGFNVVSGYAKGIDSAAHLGALHAEGTTTIVLSSGILTFEVKKEFKGVLSQFNTLILSQFNPREKWLARNAMARNKLVCALSDAVIVMACGPEVDSQRKMSGTFDAAKSAMAMNLPVFVLSPQCFLEPPVGNSELIKRGGHEISPENAMSEILLQLKRSSMIKSQQSRKDGIQLELFTAV